MGGYYISQHSANQNNYMARCNRIRHQPYYDYLLTHQLFLRLVCKRLVKPFMFNLGNRRTSAPCNRCYRLIHRKDLYGKKAETKIYCWQSSWWRWTVIESPKSWPEFKAARRLKRRRDLNLWETRSRYLFGMTPLFILLTVDGMDTAKAFLDSFRKPTQQTENQA